MVGLTLVEMRERIESLASDDGDFSLLCGRTGERPFPVAGKRFDGRAAARAAATVAEQYRAALRRYDLQLPYHDLIVREETGTVGRSAGSATASGGHDWTLTDPAITQDAAPPAAPLVEFCHDVAAAVFETLSAGGHATVETAIMDDYLALAETVADPDRLCLCLVESTAGALDATLEPDEQTAVLAGAAERLAPADGGGPPVRATFARLQRLGLIGEYSQSPTAMDRAGRRRAVDVTLRDYALSPRDGRLPTLPVVVDLHRRSLRWPPAQIRAVAAADGWRLTIVLAAAGESTGLASVPVRDGPDPPT